MEDGQDSAGRGFTAERAVRLSQLPCPVGSSVEVLVCKGGVCNDPFFWKQDCLEHWKYRFLLYCLKLFQYMHLNFGVLIKVRGLITFEMPIAIFSHFISSQFFSVLLIAYGFRWGFCRGCLKCFSNGFSYTLLCPGHWVLGSVFSNKYYTLCVYLFVYGKKTEHVTMVKIHCTECRLCIWQPFCTSLNNPNE